MTATVDHLPVIARGGHIGPAEERIIRTFARFMGAAALVFGVLLAPNAITRSAIVPPWWTVAAGVSVLVPMVGLWVASYAKDIRWIRGCATCAAVTYLVAALSWPLVVEGHIPANRDIWLATFPGLVAMATVLAWRPAASMVYMAVSASAAEVLRYVTRDNQQGVVLEIEIISVVVFCSMFVATTIAAVATGRALDRAITTSVQRSTTSATIAAREVERTRFHSLIHDRVMSTLLALSRRGNTPELSEQAAIAVAEIDALRNGNAQDDDLDMCAAIALIRAALVQIDGSTPVEVDIDGETPAVPRAAARAIAAAASEALHNSVRHADTGTRRADRLVAIDADRTGLRVVVADNGCGFDPDRVPGFQLGITMGIRERMATADGCTVHLRSAVGRGTQIALSWTTPGGDVR